MCMCTAAARESIPGIHRPAWAQPSVFCIVTGLRDCSGRSLACPCRDPQGHVGCGRCVRTSSWTHSLGLCRILGQGNSNLQKIARVCVAVLAEGTDLCEEELVPRMAALLLKLQGGLPPQVRAAPHAGCRGARSAFAVWEAGLDCCARVDRAAGSPGSSDEQWPLNPSRSCQ